VCSVVCSLPHVASVVQCGGQQQSLRRDKYQYGELPKAGMVYRHLRSVSMCVCRCISRVRSISPGCTACRHYYYRVEDMFSAENGYRVMGGLGAACISGNRKTLDSISLIQKALDNAAGFLRPERPSSYVSNPAGDTFSA
jgi:hypothetical protein